MSACGCREDSFCSRALRGDSLPFRGDSVTMSNTHRHIRVWTPCFLPIPQDLQELSEWVNPEYLVPAMVDQCAAAFNENGSTIQLHRFLKVGVPLAKPEACRKLGEMLLDSVRRWRFHLEDFGVFGLGLPRQPLLGLYFIIPRCTLQLLNGRF